MDTAIKLDSLGLDYIVENSDYILKLASALDTNNEIVKKKVFELLSALSQHSRSGYDRAIETFVHYKNLKNERYRFKVIVTELEKTTASLEYKVAVLTFLNCLIISAKTSQARIRMRNEFIGLGILPVLYELKHTCRVPNIREQLEVFFEQKECDDSQSINGPEGINLNSHLDIFYTILQQVSDTPQAVHFLNILQHLLKIDSKEPISDTIWESAETLVHRATLIEKQEDTHKLLRSPSTTKVACSQCHNRFDAVSNNRKLSLTPNMSSTSLASNNSNSVNQNAKNNLPSGVVTSPMNAAPPPPPPPPCSAPPPPPPLLNIDNKVPVPPACPPMKQSHEVTKPKSSDFQSELQTHALPQQDTPTPRSKMKTLNWNKIPHNKIVGKTNIWTIVADKNQHSPMTEINWDEMEGLFCQQMMQGSSKLVGNDSPNLERKPKKDNEITLLDGKRSLNINIFLKQFRKTNEDITEMIQGGQHDEIGSEKLRGLLKILPDFDEYELLRTFAGDRSRLGNAEKFLIHLLQVPNYKLRIECMLLKEEFSANMAFLEPSITSMLYAGEDLMTSKQLRDILYMIVVFGNFLNAGGYAGNACGIKLSSLQKITEIRANKPGMNLIHFVAIQAENKNKDLLAFPEQFTSLENASKTTIEQLNNEINALDKRISTIKRQIELPSTEDDIKLQMAEFIRTAVENVLILQRQMSQLESLRIQLSEFFCEDPLQFKIEECFKIFYQFCEKFKAAVRDNEKRKFLEEQANLRRRQREELLAARKKQFDQTSTSHSTESDNCFLMDPPNFSYDIRFSPALSRRRIGSFNSNSESFSREDTASPDVTPNGSLRRRRSRALPEEEDHNNLMDFLRSSGHNNFNRERRSAAYGSLDRSWARRARSGSSEKRRPNLLNVDFGNDRERPSSPSPNIEIKVLPSAAEVVEDPNDTTKPRISREWRQKIENWLQGNEQDEKTNEENRKKARRLTTNRRSLENDTDSEKGCKLDTLPEEKSHNSSPQQATASSGPIQSGENFNSYRRVYSEWKPSTSLENADVINEIEAISGMTYVPVSAKRNGEVDENLEMLNDVHTQSIYVRAPEVAIDFDSKTSSPTKSSSSVYIRPSPENLPTSKIEIDSDNIETPPTHRKSFQGNCQTSVKTDDKGIHIEPLEKFDRFSSTRRTRRFKKPLEINNIADDNANASTTSPESTSEKSFTEVESISKDLKEVESEKNSNVTSSKDSKNKKNHEKIIARLGKIGKNISRISQEDVREAIRSLKSPSPDRDWNGKDAIFSQPMILSTKGITHELNDEGFEETQSLVSDTPSLTTSSCNEEAAARKKISRISHDKVNGEKSMLKTKQHIPTTTQLQSLVARNQQSLERSRSLRNSNTSSLAPSRSLNSTPKRMASLRLRTSEVPPSNLNTTFSGLSRRLDVERSNSKTSLRSSRSSINSTVSTNTVKAMPLQKSVPLTTTSVPSIKKPATSSQISNSTRTAMRAPASRSSSSGSSVGQSVTKKPPILSPPFKTRVSSAPVSSSRDIQNNLKLTKTSKLSSAGGASLSKAPGSSFMRPTTSSATKVKSK